MTCKDSVQRVIVNDIVDEIVTCGRAFTLVSLILALRLELVRAYQVGGDYSLCESVLL